MRARGVVCFIPCCIPVTKNNAWHRGNRIRLFNKCPRGSGGSYKLPQVCDGACPSTRLPTCQTVGYLFIWHQLPSRQRDAPLTAPLVSTSLLASNPAPPDPGSHHRLSFPICNLNDVTSWLKTLPLFPVTLRKKRNRYHFSWPTELPKWLQLANAIFVFSLTLF